MRESVAILYANTFAPDAAIWRDQLAKQQFQLAERQRQLAEWQRQLAEWQRQLAEWQLQLAERRLPLAVRWIRRTDGRLGVLERRHRQYQHVSGGIGFSQRRLSWHPGLHVPNQQRFAWSTGLGFPKQQRAARSARLGFFRQRAAGSAGLVSAVIVGSAVGHRLGFVPAIGRAERDIGLERSKRWYAQRHDERHGWSSGRPDRANR